MKGQNEFLKTLRQVHLRFAKFFTKRIADRQVTMPQYMSMMLLLEEGAQKMHDLAVFLHVSTLAVTNLVDRLEEAGYAKRSPHPTDRRAHVVALTPEGTRLIAGLREDGLTLLKDSLGTMSSAEQEVVRRFYRNLLARLDAALERQGQG